MLGPGFNALGQIPTINTQPRSQYVAAGLNASFSSTFSGFPPTQYRWQFYSTNFPGATGSFSPASLTLTNIQFSNSGPYRVIVTNNSGSVTSLEAVLVVGTVATWGSSGFMAPTNIPLDATNVVAIASGSRHFLALKSNGVVTAWGMNSSGVTNVPVGLTNVVAIAAGNTHNVALRSDGTIVCWGSNTLGQTNVPGDLTNAVAIAAGGDHSMAIRPDGTARLWGSNFSSETNVPFGVKAVSIAAGNGHCLALTAQGTVAAWGSPGSGQTKVPAGLSNAVAIAAGQFHSLALKSDGTVAAWGDNSIGQTNVPATVTNVVAIAAGDSSCLALRNDGSVVGWGANSSGQLNVPAGFSNLVSIAAASSQAMGLRNFGFPSITVTPASQTRWAGETLALYSAATGVQPMSYQWQFNGMDISGATSASLGMSNVQRTNAGTYSVVIGNGLGAVTSKVAVVTIRQQLTIAAWGANGNGECFPPTTASNVVAMAAGGGRTLLLSENGKVTGWGSSGGFQSLTPPTLSNVIAIAAGDAHNLALKSGGSVACWGTPVSPLFTNSALVAGESFVAIAAGAYHNLGLRGDGTVRGWADSGPYGPIGYETPPAGLSGVRAIAAGLAHSLALKADGTVIGWGNNNFGQTNTPAGLSNVAAIACGYYHDIALTSNGTVVAWGDNGRNQTNVPAGLGNVIAIASHGYHNLALKSDGTLAAWGWDYSGQSTIPPGLTNVTAIATGTAHSVALVGDSSPCVTLPPRGLTTPAGTSTKFQVTVCGSAPLTYQWLHEGTNFAGATNLSLTLSNLQPADAGDYLVVASNTSGTVTSKWATLTLGPVIAWGNNSSEQTFVPAGLTNPIAVAAGGTYSLALRADGNPVAWGSQISTAPLPTNVAAIAGGPGFCALTLHDGSLAIWGLPAYSPTNRPLNLPPISAAAAGLYHVLALSSEGRVFAWGGIPGFLNQGQTNVPADLSNVVAVAAGDSHSMALRGDGTVACWGSISNAPLGLSNVVAIAAASSHSLALKDDGTLVGWGDNSYGVSSPPAALTNVIAVGSSLYDGQALQSDGTPVIWGNNDSGQRTLPAGLQNVIGFSPGYAHMLALVGDGSPKFTVQPFNRWVTAGDSVTLRVMAAGNPPLSYQWIFNGTNILGGTNSALTLTSVHLSSAGSYQCMISNAVNSGLSSTASVNVLRPPLRFDSCSITNGMLRLNLSGLVQSGPAILLVSTNLVDWEGLATNPPVFGSWEYLDATTNAAPRFYRGIETQ
jgi:alpha-tubulin suppressor-like RCC1 family protein